MQFAGGMLHQSKLLLRSVHAMNNYKGRQGLQQNPAIFLLLINLSNTALSHTKPRP